MFIKVQSYKGSGTILVNTDDISTILQGHRCCVLVMKDGFNLEVSDSFEEVESKISKLF